MTLFSRFGLLAVMVSCSLACLTETADAKWIPIFKCRQKCAEEAEPAPAPESAPECCPAPEPAPEPAPACCAAAEPAPVCCSPAPEPEPAPVCCAEPAPEPEAAPEVSPCCCSTAATEAPVAAVLVAAPASDLTAQIEHYGMPELAEGESLVSISPLEEATEEAATLTVGPKE